jgi:DNA-directed RNA polymerase alpha subunit
MIDPSPELPDDTSTESVELPQKVKDTLVAAGLKTVGDIRETPDSEILQIQNLGKSSLALLRENLGIAVLPWSAQRRHSEGGKERRLRWRPPRSVIRRCIGQVLKASMRAPV